MRKTLNFDKPDPALRRWMFDPVTVTSTTEPTEERPRTRADCVNGPRPCPWVSCRNHLALDVSANGSIKINFPNLDIWEMDETCALDIADRHADTGAPVPVIADALGVGYESASRIVSQAVDKVREAISESEQEDKAKQIEKPAKPIAKQGKKRAR